MQLVFDGTGDGSFERLLRSRKVTREIIAEDSFARSLRIPGWVGEVQDFFKAKQDHSVHDVFQPLREKFKIFDRANDGIITKDEFLEALSTSGVDVKNATLGELDSLFESFDIAGNGEISISEFVTVLGAPLIQNPNATVDDIFRETAKILLMKGNSKDVLNRQWIDICGRMGIDPQRGTLTFENFSKMMKKECDWMLTQEQLLPIFQYLDMNDNGKVSIITMRIMVAEMADGRSKGRTIMVIDLLKQAMTNAQAEVIRRQAATIQRLNEELIKEHKILQELEKNNPLKHISYPSAAQGAQRAIYVRRPMKVSTKSLASAFFSWPFLAIISWVAMLIIYILTFFAARPEGEIGVDLFYVIIPGVVLSILGVMYNIIIWPIVRFQDSVGCLKVSCSMLFGIAAPILFALGVAFMNPFWYIDIDCFSCQECGSLEESVCYGNWDLIGGWQNTCPCALQDMGLWHDAEFLEDSDFEDCNTSLAESYYFEGEYDRLKPCMFYSNGQFMKLGFAIIVATVILTGASCWGCIKDLHLWVKSVDRETDQKIPEPMENELTTVDLYS